MCVCAVHFQISRSLAAKAALAIRYDALGEDTNAEMGLENRAKLEARVRQLEERGVSTAVPRTTLFIEPLAA